MDILIKPDRRWDLQSGLRDKVLEKVRPELYSDLQTSVFDHTSINPLDNSLNNKFRLEEGT